MELSYEALTRRPTTHGNMKISQISTRVSGLESSRAMYTIYEEKQ
jgi:hypothetical protein